MSDTSLVNTDQSGIMTIEQTKSQIKLVQEAMKSVMKVDTHYGKIPGCGDKDVLFKAGAEKLGMVFRLAPKFDVQVKDLPDNHREYSVTCRLHHISDDTFVGEGVGLCSTMESKYRYRNAALKCPFCEAEAIIKGREEYGGGWLCFAKKGGCGKKFKDDDDRITKQPRGKVENPDIADVYNTVLKMAKKRAHVDAMLTATAASDIFTQDLEDFRGASQFKGFKDAPKPRQKVNSYVPPKDVWDNKPPTIEQDQPSEPRKTILETDNVRAEAIKQIRAYIDKAATKASKDKVLDVIHKHIPDNVLDLKDAKDEDIGHTLKGLIDEFGVLV
jgi:hypothetical protein